MPPWYWTKHPSLVVGMVTLARLPGASAVMAAHLRVEPFSAGGPSSRRPIARASLSLGKTNLFGATHPVGQSVRPGVRAGEGIAGSRWAGWQWL
jgi:hypothetical protein